MLGRGHFFDFGRLQMCPSIEHFFTVCEPRSGPSDRFHQKGDLLTTGESCRHLEIGNQITTRSGHDRLDGLRLIIPRRRHVRSRRHRRGPLRRHHRQVRPRPREPRPKVLDPPLRVRLHRSLPNRQMGRRRRPRRPRAADRSGRARRDPGRQGRPVPRGDRVRDQDHAQTPADGRREVHARARRCERARTGRMRVRAHLPEARRGQGARGVPRADVGEARR